MREIKFRGRDGDDWYYGSLFVNECGHTTISEPKSFWMKPVNADTVGQYTGLCDANWQKIYEGDVLVYADDDGTKLKGKVYFRDGSFYVTESGTKYGHLLDVIVKCCYPAFVIGNVHDDPDLIGASDDQRN